MSGEDLRSRYETAVSGLRARVVAMRQEGMPAEKIARLVHAERRSLAAQFKQLTPEPLHSLINRRTLARDGDPIGHTIEQLRTGQKSRNDCKLDRDLKAKGFSYVYDTATRFRVCA